MPIFQQNGEKGDLYIQFKIDFPENYFNTPEKLRVSLVDGCEEAQYFFCI